MDRITNSDVNEGTLNRHARPASSAGYTPAGIQALKLFGITWLPASAGMTKDAIHPRARHGECWHMFVKNPTPEDQVLNLKIRPHRSHHQVGSV